MFLRILTILVVLQCLSCAKDKPCSDNSTFSPDIDLVIGERIYGADSLFKSDTIITYFPNFAIGGADAKQVTEATWFVENSIETYSGKRLSLRFGSEHLERTFNIGFAYTIAPNAANCLTAPFKDTINKKFFLACGDSAFAAFYNVPYRKPVFLGKWRGSFTDEPNHVFPVTIIDFGPDPNLSDDTWNYNLRIYNMPEGCGGPKIYIPSEQFGCGGLQVSPDFYAPGMDNSYRAFRFFHGASNVCCPMMTVTGYVSPNNNNQIEINYENHATQKTRKFIGKREN
jgi:hypothetical protein